MSNEDSAKPCIQDRIRSVATSAIRDLMTREYIILFLLAFLSMGVSFFLQKIFPWGSDLFSNIGTGFICSIALYYLIERVQVKMQKERERPLQRSILFKIAKHFEVILAIYAGIDLSYLFIEEDADKQFRIEVIGLKSANNIIGFNTLPSDFQNKFLKLIDIIELPLPESDDYLISVHELSVAKEIKELLEMMLAIDIELGFIALENIIKKAEGTIERLEYTLSRNSTSA